MYIMEEIYVYMWTLYIKSLITVPCLAHFSMPSFYLCLSHCRTCTVWLMVWLKRRHKSSSREWWLASKLMHFFHLTASQLICPIKTGGLDLWPRLLSLHPDYRYHLPSAVTTTSSSTCQVVKEYEGDIADLKYTPLPYWWQLSTPGYRHRNRLQCQIVPLHSVNYISHFFGVFRL